MDLRESAGTEALTEAQVRTSEHPRWGNMVMCSPDSPWTLLVQGSQLATRIHAKKYIECSAMTRDGLEEVFHEAIKQVLFADEPAKKKKCVLL